jgi:ABC-type sugar transport system ATPase subunit
MRVRAYRAAAPYFCASSSLGRKTLRSTAPGALSDSGAIAGTVIATETLGSETIVFGNLQSGENLTASIRGILSLRQGANVRFSVDRRFVHVFDDRRLTLPPLRSWREDYVDG